MSELKNLKEFFPSGPVVKVTGIAQAIDENRVKLDCEIINPADGKVIEKRRLGTWDYSHIQVDADMIVRNFTVSSNNKWLINPESTGGNQIDDKDLGLIE